LVYFAQDLKTRFIKIGCSDIPDHRIKSVSYSVNSKLKLLGVMEGSFKEERSIHKHFSSVNVYSEWFYPVSSLHDFIKNNTYELKRPKKPKAIYSKHSYGLDSIREMLKDNHVLRR